ncbi:hypothetical protein QOM21_04925 [Streptomyces sp. Pv4-95]
MPRQPRPLSRRRALYAGAGAAAALLEVRAVDELFTVSPPALTRHHW